MLQKLKQSLPIPTLTQDRMNNDKQNFQMGWIEKG